MWEGNDSMIQQCMRVMEGQSTVNYANSTNCVLTLVSFVCGSTAKAHLFFSFFVCFLCICLLSVKQARTCQQTVLTPPQPTPPPTQTHAHRVPLKTAFHSLHIQTQLLCYLTFQRHSSHTAFHPEVDKATKNSRAVLFSFLWPFFPSLLPHGFLLLSLFLPVYLSLQTSASFLPLFHRQSGLPSPIPSFLSWHVKLLWRNSCAYTADLYQQKKIPHQPAEHLDEAGKCVLQDSDVYNVCTDPKQKEKALYLSHLP